MKFPDAAAPAKRTNKLTDVFSAASTVYVAEHTAPKKGSWSEALFTVYTSSAILETPTYISDILYHVL